MSKKRKQSMTEIKIGKYDLVLPRDVSFALKSIINGRAGMIIPNGSIELLEGNELEIFSFGVKNLMDKLELTPQIWENLKSMSKAVASGQIADIWFHYKISEDMSIGVRSIMLLNDVDYWDLLWNGFSYYYGANELNGRYDEYINLANEILKTINQSNSKVDLNSITMKDLAA